MKKIKIIDLLNMISKGEEVPNKIKYYNVIYTYNNKGDYCCEDSEEYYNDSLLFPQVSNVESFLNDELEIIEEKKIPEKIYYQFSLNYINCNINKEAKEEINKEINNINNKINEIIDYLKSKGE